MTWVSILKSKTLQYIAIAGAVLVAFAYYGARRKEEGKASLRQEIQELREAQRAKFDEIRDNTPLSGNTDWLLNDAKERSTDKSSRK